MTNDEAIRILRKEIECLSHTKCEDCILEKVCDPMKTPTDDKYIEIYGMAIKALEQEQTNGDCISREAIKKYLSAPNEEGDRVIYEDDLDLLPSVQPKTDTDCISRKDIQDYIAEYLSQYLYDDVREAIEDIDVYIGDMPRVQPKTEILLKQNDSELNRVKDELEPKCDRINSLASILPYAAHREIQELLCEIMNLCKTESED